MELGLWTVIDSVSCCVDFSLNTRCLPTTAADDFDALSVTCCTAFTERGSKGQQVVQGLCNGVAA